jgi:hypothetical protein
MTVGILYITVHFISLWAFIYYSGSFYINGDVYYGHIMTVGVLYITVGVLYHCGNLYITVGVFILMWVFLYDCFIYDCGHFIY